MKTNNISAFTTLLHQVENGLDTYLEQLGQENLSIHDFLKERVFIRNKFKNIVPLIANPLQLQHQRIKEEHRKAGRTPHYLLLKYRRGGMTTWEQGTSYRIASSQANSNCVTLAHTKEDTKTIFKMVRLMKQMDPKAEVGGTESSIHITFPTLNSEFKIGTAGAKAFSRGDTLDKVHGSEVAWWEGDEDTINNLAAGLTEAASHGEVVFETTANGAYGWYYEKFKEAMQGDNSWIPLFYPWFIDPTLVLPVTSEDRVKLLDTLTDEENVVCDKYNLSIEQLAWRRSKKFQLKKLFPQEYPETWEEAFLVRGYTFFDLDTVNQLSLNTSEPLKQQEHVTFWEMPKKGEEYCAGADVAEGNVDSDFNVMGILNKRTGKQACVLRGKWRPEVFARKCIDLCKMFNNAIFACEINNHGHSCMNTVLNTLMYKHVYKRKKPLDKNKFGGDKVEHVPGWLTNGKTRPILLDDLNEAVENGYMLVNDKILISEMKTFVEIDGKYQAGKQQHDDTIMAWGIAWQCRKQKKKSYISV